MKQIPSNVPAFIQDFKEGVGEVKRYTKAKLKIFYVGETADHRLFTKEFSDKLLKTLPLTPVVGYYSKQDDDFRGHNLEQYIYGVVPENAEITYETDDNNTTWAITDVILYTERDDNIGEVASKIIGKQHSLELDPRTLQYQINHNELGGFKNIEFLEGSFIGLSVLGDDETPAFTGSAFFKYEEISEKFRENFNLFLEYLKSDGGKIEVFDLQEYLNKVNGAFATRIAQETEEAIYGALNEANICGYIVQNNEEFAVIYRFDEDPEMCGYYKYSLSFDENNKIALGLPERVFARYLTAEQIAALEQPATEPTFEKKEDEEVKEEQKCKKEEKPEPKVKEAGNCDNVTEPSVEKESDKKADKEQTDEKSDENKQEDEVKKQEEVEMGNATASVSVTTLAEDERLELDSYRRAEKQALIEEYRGDLDNELLNTYLANVDNYSKQDLEAELAIAFHNAAKLKEEPVIENKIEAKTFSIIEPTTEYNPYDPAAAIKKYNY